MKKNKMMWLISLVPMIVTAAVLPLMPEQVPMHYNAAGVIDRWGSKYEQLIFPLLILLISAFWQCFISHFQKKSEQLGDRKEGREAASNAKILRLVGAGEALLFSVMHFVLLYNAHREALSLAESHMVDFPGICNILLGVFLVGIGNYLPRSKRNCIVGFRTAKSMSSEEIWSKSNRAAGIALILTGILAIILSLIVGGMLSTFMVLGLLICMTLILQIYVSRL